MARRMNIPERRVGPSARLCLRKSPALLTGAPHELPALLGMLRAGFWVPAGAAAWPDRPASLALGPSGPTGHFPHFGLLFQLGFGRMNTSTSLGNATGTWHWALRSCPPAEGWKAKAARKPGWYYRKRQFLINIQPKLPLNLLLIPPWPSL